MQSVKRIIWTLVQNRLGFERTKFITMFIIMACPFAAPFILQKGAVIQRYIELLPPMLQPITIPMMGRPPNRFTVL